MVEITFPDGTKKKFEKASGMDVARSISEGLARASIAVEVNGNIQDLDIPIEEDSTVKIITWKDDKGKEIFRHSAAHVFAHALTNLYPDAKIAIGPAIEDGFHYDFELEHKISPEDLPKIEEEMKKIVKEKIEIKRKEIPKKEALELFKDNKFKTEMIKELDSDKIRIYEQGDFSDFCKGPHVPNTGYIKAFKLTKISGAYWKGNSENEQLQRVYGIAYPDKKEMKQYLNMIEEAKKRDHKKIGKEMDLFSFHEEGPGFPFFHAKGTIIYNELLDFMRSEMMKRDYEENRTPIILNKSLWLKSGHWDHYKENMYFTKIDSDEENYAVKPMNCPGNLLVFKNKVHSYRDLPIKAGEFGLVHRHEMSGVLNGLFRVRNFTQDDAHVFCTEEQLEEQIIELIDFIDMIYKTFDFEYHVELSTKPEKAMGSDEIWDKAESILKKILEKKKMDFIINEGDGAFYGPKIDYHLKDAIGRTWQCGTIQLDFSMPEKFELEYEGNDGKKHRPVMLHRAIYGSIERFLGMLVEHYAGKFPLWLSPVQVRLLPIADRHIDYCKQVKEELKKNGIRSEIDDHAETTNKKIRNAQLANVNYILVVGDKEIENDTVNVRTRDEKVHGEKKIKDLVLELLKEIEEKR